jgi:hypothetical protein
VPVSGDDATVPAGPTPARATRTGAIVGTPPYMAPEQHAGGEIDRRADVFSFCVSAYEGVYGERPFAAAPDRPRHVAWAEAIAAGVIRPAPRGRRVPAAVRKALVRGLAVDPAARWPSMEPLLAALERALGRRKRIAIAAFAVTAVAAIGALLVIARARPDDACAADASSLADRWAARRPDVRAALVATGTPWAAGQAARALTALDRYAGEWGTVRETGCRDAARSALAPDAWRARRACLDQAAIAFDARVDLLAKGGADAAAHAVDLARPPPLASCLDPSSDTADRAGDAAILGLVAQLEAARGLYDAGRYRDAERSARALRDRATAAGDRIEAGGAALVIAGVDVFYSEKLDEAEQLARDTAVSASATRDDWRAAEAWRFVLDAKAQGGHLDGLDYAITAARAAAARTDAEQQIVIDAAAGDALVRAQRFDDARALCEPALARADQALGPGDIARDDALTCMADLSSRSGNQADALRFASRAVGEQVARYGPRHPLVADALHNYGVTLDHSGDVRDELVVRWCAHTLIVEHEGLGSADAGESLAGLAIALSQTGDAADRAAARAALDRANAILPAALAADDPRLITFRSMRAYTLDGIGDHDAAIAAYADLERDLEALRPVRIDLAIVTINYSDALRSAHRCAEALPIDDRVTPLVAELPRALTVFVEGARAGCRLDTGRAAAAARDLGAAWAAIDPGDLSPPDRGELELILAHALDRGGGDRAQALALAKQARADLGASAAAELDPLIARLGR